MTDSLHNSFGHAQGVKFASIDIGTNAVRLLLSRVIQNGGAPLFKKESLVRIPIRLGEDVFSVGAISDQKKRSLVRTMVAYKNLMEAYGSTDYLACATSAMREADNGNEVIEAIRNEAGIELEVIDGRREVEIICRNRPLPGLEKVRCFLHVDVGGGSTDIAVFSDNQVAESCSFRIGGVRILADGVDKDEWKGMKRWVKEVTASYRPSSLVGSGGNINKAFSMSRKKEGESISCKKLSGIFKELRKHSYEELIRNFQMRSDRADVIVPALDIYLSIMKWAKAKEMVVPVQGLPDGLIHLLYEKHLQTSSEPENDDESTSIESWDAESEQE
ncbi:MAG TPA: exopolyphosphatase [candidate division Zixibacteria bacterium]|nr:exopolyphosphatase [candidate division Zixibacteria bacterium]